MASSFPLWYLLKPVSELEIDWYEWKSLGLARGRILANIQEDISKVETQDYSRSTLRRNAHEYHLGHLFLRLVGAKSDRIEAWIVEGEGDLFIRLFQGEFEEVQTLIARDIFGKSNFMTFSEYSKTEDVNIPRSMTRVHTKLWVVHFSVVPWLIEKKKGILRGGWVIAKRQSFFSSLKARYEQILIDEIDRLKPKLGIDQKMDEVISEAEKELAEKIAIPTSGKDFIDIDHEIWQGIQLYGEKELYPPCLRVIYAEMDTKGYLPHVQRWYLGVFMKKLGMSSEEQLRFWFYKSVDNKGKSWETFKRQTGYQIRHLYGEEGGGKNYNLPKCSKVGTDFFCFFTHLSPEIQYKLLENYPNLSKEQTSLIIERGMYRANHGCSLLYRSLYQKPLRIVHPLQWTKGVIEEKEARMRIQKEKEEKEQLETTSEKKKEKPKEGTDDPR